MPDTVRILVGTKKGGFIYTSDRTRERWEQSEPILPGWTIHHMSADLREATPRLYAAANHWAWGPSVAKSTDGGKTWDYRSAGLAFPADMRSPSTGSRGGAPGTPGGTGLASLAARSSPCTCGSGSPTAWLPTRPASCGTASSVVRGR